jgi:hypothetical protein
VLHRLSELENAQSWDRFESSRAAQLPHRQPQTPTPPSSISRERKDRSLDLPDQIQQEPQRPTVSIAAATDEGDSR